MKSGQELQTAVFNSVAKMEAEISRGAFTPFLEGDTVGYLYYRFVTDGVADANELHVMTRIVGLDRVRKGRWKVDLAAGQPILTAVGASDRSTIDANLAIEVKFFSADKNQGELGNALNDAWDDVLKLAEVRRVRKRGLFVVLLVDIVRYFDEGETAYARVLGMQREAANLGVQLWVSPARSPHYEQLETVYVGTRQLTVGQKLFAWYKDREYQAEITPRGTVLAGGREYRTLSEAGCGVSGMESCDGPGFWNIG